MFYNWYLYYVKLRWYIVNILWCRFSKMIQLCNYTLLHHNNSFSGLARMPIVLTWWETKHSLPKPALLWRPSLVPAPLITGRLWMLMTGQGSCQFLLPGSPRDTFLCGGGWHIVSLVPLSPSKSIWNLSLAQNHRGELDLTYICHLFFWMRMSQNEKNRLKKSH